MQNGSDFHTQVKLVLEYRAYSYSSLHKTEAAKIISHKVMGSFINPPNFFPIVNQKCSGFVYVEGSTTLSHSGPEFYSDLSSDNTCWYSAQESEKKCHPRAKS